MSVCERVLTFVFVLVCMYASIPCMCIYVCMCVYVHIFTCVHMRV